MKLVLATNNPAKVKEINSFFASYGITVISPADFGLSISPKETGKTFHENAKIKAVETLDYLKEHGITDHIVLADDSGLEIQALENELGVDSALFMGESTPYLIRNKAILDRLQDIPPKSRGCRFVCVIAAAYPDGKVFFAEGEVTGIVADKIMGENGFGYDPIFFLPEFNKTMAELTDKEKESVSHRGNALRALISKFLCFSR